jgi:hypothetical protein
MSEYQQQTPQAVLAEVVLLQCKERGCLCAARLRSQFPVGLVKFFAADVPRLSTGRPGFPNESRLAGMRRVLRTLSSSTKSGSCLVFIVDSARDSLEDAVAVAAVARELAPGTCAVLCFDDSGADELDTPHSVEEIGTGGAAFEGTDSQAPGEPSAEITGGDEPTVHRFVARPFVPQQEDAKWSQATSFFADCACRTLHVFLQLDSAPPVRSDTENFIAGTSAYSAAAKFVFQLHVFQRPYSWFILRQALLAPSDTIAVEDGG